MLKKRNYNIVDMYKKVEVFFVSIGWNKLSTLFWNKSMLVQPPDRNVTCHGSAWDFVNGEADVRFVYYCKDSVDCVVITNGTPTSCNYVSYCFINAYKSLNVCYFTYLNIFFNLGKDVYIN